MDKENVLFIQWNKKKEILPFLSTQMDLAYAKWNKSDGERQILYELTHIMESKRKQN